MFLGGGERRTPGAAQNIPGKDAPRPGKECDKKTKGFSLGRPRTTHRSPKIAIVIDVPVITMKPTGTRYCRVTHNQDCGSGLLL